MHINRNMRTLDRLIQQIETTRQVQRPSDNPIIASRALKFRTGVRETEQFLRNVDTASAWMNVSESSFINVVEGLMREIHERLVQGANDTNSPADKMIIVTQISQLVDQIGIEMNQTFAGRHVLSGFRTDQPPTFTSDNDRTFIITQHFNLSHINREQSWQKFSQTSEPYINYVNVLRLAYTGMGAPFGPPVLGTQGLTYPPPIAGAANGINIPGFHVIQRSIDDPQAYHPPAGFVAGQRVLHFIPETGELVMHDDAAATFPREGVSVTYEKTGFRRGELNPMVYFTGREIVAPTGPLTAADRVFEITQYFSRSAGTPIMMPGGVPGFVFPLAYAPSFGMADPAIGLRPQLPPGSLFAPPGTVVIPATVFDRNDNVSVRYNVELAAGVPSDALMADVRVQGVRLVRAIDAGGVAVPLDQADHHRTFDMHNQRIYLELATSTHMHINALSKNVFTDKMFGDLRRFIEFSKSLVPATRTELEQYFSNPPHNLSGAMLTQAVTTRETLEEGRMRSVLYTQFDNMLYRMSQHLSQATREHTSLGTRMLRLDFMQTRLEQDEFSYTRLMSDNEDTDIPRALMLKMSAEAIFHASLRANSGIIQLTLANFIG
jgi:flagellin-like hook-associated protein FlgL